MNDPTCPFHSEGKGSIIKVRFPLILRGPIAHVSRFVGFHHCSWASKIWQFFQYYCRWRPRCSGFRISFFQPRFSITKSSTLCSSQWQLDCVVLQLIRTNLHSCMCTGPTSNVSRWMWVLFVSTLLISISHRCIEPDLANNTFSSFSSIRRDIAKYDPAQFEYTQYLSMIVRNWFCYLENRCPKDISSFTGFLRRVALP